MKSNVHALGVETLELRKRKYADDPTPNVEAGRGKRTKSLAQAGDRPVGAAKGRGTGEGRGSIGGSTSRTRVDPNTFIFNDITAAVYKNGTS